MTKRTGGVRVISIPPTRLARVQRRILNSVLVDSLSVDSLSVGLPGEVGAAHGFIPGRSTVTAARPHVGRKVVVNVDLLDFFPSIRLARVREVFEHLGDGGYLGDAAHLLALLCTESISAERSMRDRWLPQGACTSPAITNLVCEGLDDQLLKVASEESFTYTRYADDLTFSGNDRDGVGRLLYRVRDAVADHHFAIHESKTRVLVPGRRQEVVGLTVNDRLNVPRRQRRRLRAALHRARLDGVSSAKAREIAGSVGYVMMAAPDRAETWVEKRAAMRVR